MLGHFIADRLHVSSSKLDVCRATRGMLKPEAQKSRDPIKRENRRALYTQALAAHKENQELYRAFRF